MVHPPHVPLHVRQDAAVNREFALEQARPSLGSEPEDEHDQAPPRRRNRPAGADKQGKEGNDQAADEAAEGPDPGGSDEGGKGQDRPDSGRRRTGGAGGASQDPPGSPGESPDDRLESALEEIRDASRRRLPEEKPADSPADPRKDW